MKVGDRVRVKRSPTLLGANEGEGTPVPEWGMPGEVGTIVEVDGEAALVAGVGRAGRWIRAADGVGGFWHWLVDLEPAPEERWRYCDKQESIFDASDNLVGRHQPATGRVAAAAPAMRALLERLVAVEGPQPGTVSWAGEVRDLLASLVEAPAPSTPTSRPRRRR